MKNIILNTGNLNIEIIPGTSENWWKDEPTYTVRDLLFRSGYDHYRKEYEYCIIVYEFEKVKYGIHTGGAYLYMDFPMVWGENIVFLHHFVENNGTVDRYYITNNFNSNVQLIVEILMNDVFKNEKERFLVDILKKLKEKE